jgi:hypothetical protein
MPFFTLQVSSRGLIVEAAVLVSQSRREALEKAGQAVPEPQRVYALLDTGASCSAVDQSALDALGLTPTGEAEILTPSTGHIPQKTSTYDVQIGIFAGRPGDPHYLSAPIEVMASDLFAGQGIHVLIGRDILANCILQYNGADEIFTLAY